MQLKPVRIKASKVSNRKITKKKVGSGYVEHIAGTSGQTYHSGSAKDTPFFDFKVIDNLKKAARRLGMDVK